MNNKIKIVLADDEHLFRQGLKSILESNESIDILFDAKDGKHLMQLLRAAKTLPEIVVTDLKMPEINGVEATKLIRKEFPDIKIIALTSYFSKPFILNMISIGAVAYLAKNSTPTLMIKTIQEVADKGFCYNKEVMQYIYESILNPADKKVKSTFDASYFTSREMEVLKLICQQLTTNDIGEKLFISPRTVEGHRNNLLIKTESKNVAGLVIYALKNKLVSLEKDTFE